MLNDEKLCKKRNCGKVEIVKIFVDNENKQIHT